MNYHAHTKQEILNLVDTMVSAAANFSGQGYSELISTRQVLTEKLDELEEHIGASVVLQKITKLLYSDVPASVKDRLVTK